MQIVGRKWVVIDEDENEVTYYFGLMDGSFYIREGEKGEWVEADMVFYKGHFILATTDDAPMFDVDDVYWNMEQATPPAGLYGPAGKFF